MTEPSWVGELREAARGKAQAGVEVVRGERPSWLASGGIAALTSLVLAAFLIAAARFRSQIAPLSFDLIALLLRTAALAFAVRALLAVLAFVRQAQRTRAAAEHVLAWSPAGIFERMGTRERWAERSDALAVVAAETIERRGALPFGRPVYLVLKPTRAVEQWELPSYLAPTPELLVARLNRWLGSAASATGERPVPAEDETERYLRAVRGQLAEGELVIPEGVGYRKRAPYTALLGLSFALDAMRVAGPLRLRLLPAVSLAAALSVGFVAVWFVWMRRRRATRLGIAMLLTREELLVRGAQGVVSVPWAQLASADLRLRLAWSPFVGSFVVRSLDLQTLDATRLTFDAGFLGVPVEVLSALIEAYRRGRV